MTRGTSASKCPSPLALPGPSGPPGPSGHVPRPCCISRVTALESLLSPCLRSQQVSRFVQVEETHPTPRTPIMHLPGTRLLPGTQRRPTHTLSLAHGPQPSGFQVQIQLCSALGTAQSPQAATRWWPPAWSSGQPAHRVAGAPAIPGFLPH